VTLAVLPPLPPLPPPPAPQVFDNVVVQPRDAREASDVFYRQRIGDVLLTYENEVVLTNQARAGWGAGFGEGAGERGALGQTRLQDAATRLALTAPQTPACLGR
jgi:hypothetical protein